MASMREKERLKQAEMIAEKSLLRRRQEIEAVNKELELEMNIAKSRARERVYALMIEEELCNFANESVVKSTPLKEDNANEENGCTTQENVNVQNAGITEVNANLHNASIIQDNANASNPTNGNATESNITATKTNVTKGHAKSAQVRETEWNVNAVTHHNESVRTVTTTAKPNTDVPYTSPVKHGSNDYSSEGKEKETYSLWRSMHASNPRRRIMLISFTTFTNISQMNRLD